MSAFTGPFRALIQMAKGFKDPTSVIQPVLPFPLDTPGIVDRERVLRKEEEQQIQTSRPSASKSTCPPTPSQASEP